MASVTQRSTGRGLAQIATFAGIIAVLGLIPAIVPFGGAVPITAQSLGIMLAGAFPLVWAINTYLRKPLAAAGRKFGISSEGSAGVLAAATNPIALFHLIRSIPPKDKVLAIAFCVTAGALVGDHLAFSANFQPNMIVLLMVGKVVAGVLGMLIAQFIAVPTARRLEANDRQDGTIQADEYVASEAGATDSPTIPDAEPGAMADRH